MNFLGDNDKYQDLCTLIEEQLENNSLDLYRLDMLDFDIDVKDSGFTTQDTEDLFQQLMKARIETRHAINCRENKFYFSQLSSKVIGRNKGLNTQLDSKSLTNLVVNEIVLSKILSHLQVQPSENTLLKSECAICGNELSAEDRQCPVCKESISGDVDPHEDNKPSIKEVFEEKLGNLCTYCDCEIISSEDECGVCGGPPVGPEENDAHFTKNHEYITPYENSRESFSMGQSSDYMNIEIMPISPHLNNKDMKVTERCEEHHYKVEPRLIEGRDCVQTNQNSKEDLNIKKKNKLESSFDALQNSNECKRTKGEHEARLFHDDLMSWNGADSYACAGIISLDNKEGTFEIMSSTVNHNPYDTLVTPMDEETDGTDSRGGFDDLEESSRKTFVEASPIKEVDCGLSDFTGNYGLKDAESPKAPLRHSLCDLRCDIEEGKLAHEGKDSEHLHGDTMHCPSFPNMTDQGHSKDQNANEDRAAIDISSSHFSSKSLEKLPRRGIEDSSVVRDYNEDGPKNGGVTIFDPSDVNPPAGPISFKKSQINSIKTFEDSFSEERGYSSSDMNEDSYLCLGSPQPILHSSEDLKESFKSLNDKSIISPSKRSCAQCGFLNSAPQDQCMVCKKCLPFVKKLPCKICTFDNDRFATECVACGAVNEDLEICKNCDSFMINKRFSDVCDKCFEGDAQTKIKEICVEDKDYNSFPTSRICPMCPSRMLSGYYHH